MYSKEQFNWVWKDTSREGILNQFYYDHLEMEKYKNIINELEKEFEWQLKKQIDIDKFAEEHGFLNYNPVKLMVEHFNNKLKELKENNK